MKPTIGRIVLFVLSAACCEAIENDRKASCCHGDELAGAPHQQKRGNPVSEGMVCCAQVVATWGGTCVNLKVNLDGNDTYWVTSASHDQENKAPRTWHWMDYQVDAAAKEKTGAAGPLDQRAATEVKDKGDTKPPDKGDAVKADKSHKGHEPTPEQPAAPKGREIDSV